jgi:DNA polymerase III subunit epsilon
MPEIDLETCIYIVFDLETAEFSRGSNAIIEIACDLIDSSGSSIPDGRFASLVRPPSFIPSFITEITCIRNSMVNEASKFDVVAKEFVMFLVQKLRQFQEDVFVARRFDLPLLLRQLANTK